MASLLVSQSAVYWSALENIPMHLVFSRHYSRPVSTEKRLKGQRTHFTLFQFVTLSELRSSCLVCGLSVRTQITLSGAWTLCHCQYSDHPVRCLDSVTVSELGSPCQAPGLCHCVTTQIILSGAWTLSLSELKSPCQAPGLCHCVTTQIILSGAWTLSLSELRSPCQAPGLCHCVTTQIILSGAWTLCHCQNSDHPVRHLDFVTVSELRLSCQVCGLKPPFV